MEGKAETKMPLFLSSGDLPKSFLQLTPKPKNARLVENYDALVFHQFQMTLLFTSNKKNRIYYVQDFSATSTNESNINM